MDVDGDVEGKLAQQMSCMGTNDKEVLVREFQKVLGPYKDLPQESCAFFLDMNNWNLQAALGSFYDYAMSQENSAQLMETLSTTLPSMEFVRDITIGEGESVPKDTKFDKTWRIKNPSDKPWPLGCFLKHIEGPLLAPVSSVPVPALQPGEEGDISVHMLSPPNTGIYQSRWQLNTMGGIPFGESIWSIIAVDEGGLLGITQQMASATCGNDAMMQHAQSTPEESQQPSPAPIPNIFGGYSPAPLNESNSGFQNSAPFAQSSSTLCAPILTNSQSWGGATSTSTTLSYGQTIVSPASDQPSGLQPSGMSIDSSRLNASPISLYLDPSTEYPAAGRLSLTPPMDSSQDLAMEGNLPRSSSLVNAYSADDPPDSGMSNSNLDSSILANRGSPAPVGLSFLEVDAPASPNGSSALYEAVAAAMPSWYQGGGEAADPNRLGASPIDIPSGTPESSPRVPPCTPCSPSTPRTAGLFQPPHHGDMHN